MSGNKPVRIVSNYSRERAVRRACRMRGRQLQRTASGEADDHGHQTSWPYQGAVILPTAKFPCRYGSASNGQSRGPATVVGPCRLLVPIVPAPRSQSPSNRSRAESAAGSGLKVRRFRKALVWT
jgi:hypothetical protein